MNAKTRRNYQISVVLLAIAMVVCFYVQYTRVSSYNQTLRVSEGPSDDEDCSAVIVERGDKTASWYKQDTGLTGQIFDATVYNKTSNMVSSWTMTINITDSCYLNQFWNGQVEIHQHVSQGTEIVQTLTLAKYDQDALVIDYRMDGSDLLIPLERGDYIVYHPTSEFSEVPLDPASQTVVGMVLYYFDDVDLADYHVDYYLHREVTEGVPFILSVVAGALMLLVIVIYLVAQHTYRQAEKALELRKSGLSCMSEIYTVIYLIDLVANTVVPVGVDKESDELRPKALSPNDQLKNMLRTDAESAYLELAFAFCDLDTIRERMKERNNIAFEYESRSFGWCRLRFIAMDRNKSAQLEKVLFTIEQIDEERRELSEILNHVMATNSAIEEQQALFESMSIELEESLDALVTLDERILRDGGEDAAIEHVQELYEAGNMSRWLVSNAVDYTQIKAGNVEVTPDEYQLKDLVLGAEDLARPLLKDGELAFETEVTQSLPQGLRGDEPKLRQVIANLLLYAAAVEGADGAKLSVFGKTVGEDSLHMLVSVTTLREANADQVVQPEEKHGEPEGVGMVSARAMLLLMGAKLSVTDAYGGGKNLYFEIEQKIVDKTPIGPLDEAGAKRGAH